MNVDGRCLCGYLTYEAEVDPASVRLCHCTDCQTVSGSAFRATVLVTSGFRFNSGEPKAYVKVADSGRQRVLAFCPGCGTSIYSRPPDGEVGHFGLRVGPLRQRDALTPRAQYWCSSAQTWINDLARIPAFERGSTI
jgi:hypothetical protein